MVQVITHDVMGVDHGTILEKERSLEKLHSRVMAKVCTRAAGKAATNTSRSDSILGCMCLIVSRQTW